MTSLFVASDNGGTFADTVPDGPAAGVLVTLQLAAPDSRGGDLR